MSGLPAVGHGTLWMQMGFTHVAKGYPDDDPTAWLCACLAGYLTPTGMFMSALFKSLCVKVALKGFDPHQLGGLDPGLKVHGSIEIMNKVPGRLLMEGLAQRLAVTLASSLMLVAIVFSKAQAQFQALVNTAVHWSG